MFVELFPRIETSSDRSDMFLDQVSLLPELKQLFCFTFYKHLAPSGAGRMIGSKDL